MKYRIRLAEGDWHVPEVKTFWGWKQISGGRTTHDKAVMEIGRYAIGQINQ